MDKAKAYIDEHKERFVGELFELLRIPSVSAQSVHAPDVVRCAELLAGLLVRSGADRAEVMPTEGNPIVYAEKIVDPAAKTVLVYGHYDVMPVDPPDRWETDPFEPVVRDGRIRARGADDDKGQLYMHVKALETMLRPARSRNVKTRSKRRGDRFGQHRPMVRLSPGVVEPTSFWSGYQLATGRCRHHLRPARSGVTLRSSEGPNRDLHSGLYGGAVANPINVLSGMIASLIDAEGRITIPGFYDGIRELAPQEHREFAAAPFCEAAYCKSLGILETQGEKGYTTLERTGIRPSLDVNGIWGGYTGEGAKTVIPSSAYAKISMRLVPGQDFQNRGAVAAFSDIAPRSESAGQSAHGARTCRRPICRLTGLLRRRSVFSPRRSVLFGGSILYQRFRGTRRKSILMGSD
ncbi:MAG: M20/M25/M40 family metallo-hydrolase [Alistipes sp.]